MRTPINVDQIVKSEPSENKSVAKTTMTKTSNLTTAKSNGTNNKKTIFMKHFLNNDSNTLNIIPPGLLPSDTDTCDSESYSLSDIEIEDNKTNHKNQQNEIHVTNTIKNKKRRNVISITQIGTKSSKKSESFKSESKKAYSGLTNLLNATLKKDLLAKQNEYRKNKKTTDLPDVQTRYEIKKDQTTKSVAVPYYNANSNSNILNKKSDTKYSTSIILNLDKYKVTDSTSNSHNTMVGMPAPPKKYNTFVANDGNKKDTMNVGFGDMPKPVTRTGSTINPNTVKPSTKNPTIIRRHNPKEFLSATMSPRDSTEYKTPIRTTLENVNEEIITNSQHVAKSLPSYDEALKRTVYDSNLSRVPSKVSADCPVHGGIMNPNSTGSNINSNKINVAASTPILPTSPLMQQNMRTTTTTTNSILPTLTPSQQQQQQQQMQITKPSGNNLIISNAPKQYFKPHDLNSQAPNSSRHYNGSTTTLTTNTPDLYQAQKSAVDRLYSGMPVHKVQLNANKYQSNGYIQQSSMQLQQTSNLKPNAPPPPPPPPPPTQIIQPQPVPPLLTSSQQQQQQPIVVSPRSASNNNNNLINSLVTNTPKITSRPSSSLGNNGHLSSSDYYDGPLIKHQHQQQQQQQQQQQKQYSNWKTPSVPNSSPQPNHDHNKKINNNNDIDIINNNINNTLNKHINEDILQLQARDAYSITGSSNGSSEYQHLNNQQLQQQHQQNLKNQQIQKQNVNTQSNKVQAPSPQLIIKSTDKITSNTQQQQQQQQVPKQQPLQLSPTIISHHQHHQQHQQQQQQQQPGVNKTIQQTTLNANLAFIEEDSDKLNKNILHHPHNMQRNSESFDEENFIRNGVDGDDDDDGSSTLSSNSSIPQIKHQHKQIKNHMNTNEKSKALLKNKNLEQDYGRIFSGTNNNNNNNNMNGVNKLAMNLPNSISGSTNLVSGSTGNLNANSNHAVKPGANRPPCRLNFYEKDSDTNTNSEISPSIAGIGGVPSITGSNNGPPIGNAISGISKTYPALMKEAKNGNNMLSDSPDISELSSAAAAGGGGGRTSTPNLTKRKRSSSVSSRDVKVMRRQIEDLEKMYQEILRLLEADNKSVQSKGSAHSSTTISSFTSSKDTNNKKPRRFMSIYQPPSSSDNNSKSYEFKQISHRFSRLENHVITLAKTVAHISSEVQSIKSIEEEIYNIRKDVNDLKYLNTNQPNSNIRSLSEPNFVNNIIPNINNMNTLNNNNNNNNNNQNFMYNNNKPTTSNSQNFISQNQNQQNQDLFNDKDKLRVLVPSLTNPRRLRKLTKFFGEEPPMLRLFLQKLGYESYATNFENERITITELPYCSEERLKTLGIPLGPRLRILQEAQMSFKQENYNVFII